MLQIASHDMIMHSSGAECVPLMCCLSQAEGLLVVLFRRRSREARQAEQWLVVVMCSLLRSSRARAQLRGAGGRGRGQGVAARHWPPHANALNRLRAQSLRAYREPTIVSATDTKTRKLVRARLSETFASKNCRMRITRNSKKTLLDGRFLLGIYSHVPDESHLYRDARHGFISHSAKTNRCGPVSITL